MWLWSVIEWVVLRLQIRQLSLVFISGKQVSHHDEPFLELVEAPHVNLVIDEVIHADLNLFLARLKQTIHLLAGVRLIGACGDEAEAESNVLVELLSDLIGLVDGGLNVVCHLAKDLLLLLHRLDVLLLHSKLLLLLL